ncbi:hypothetical protein ACFVHW_31785 [Streptomyces sp. NPDC127110]|uniref:hypothetical protein n=1 Tax=Streptomyces sp. NPDC127110 TaxID=3345362 RepID=UPI00362D32F1
MTAHPPRVRWHVETYDPLANEWSSALPLLDRQAAVKKLDHLRTTRPTWPDGTPCRRRLVVETTTYEDLSADPADRIARFPQAGFILPGPDGQDLAAFPGRTPDGRPAIRFSVGNGETGHAEACIPLELLEEVIAGQRDVARQSAYAVAQHQPSRFPGDSPAMRAAAISGVRPDRRRTLTELEHTAAWHAIEATAGEDGADPGTVLAAVLRALDIAPPNEAAGPRTVAVNLDLGPAAERTFRDRIRRTVQQGPEGAGA